MGMAGSQWPGDGLKLLYQNFINRERIVCWHRHKQLRPPTYYANGERRPSVNGVASISSSPAQRTVKVIHDTSHIYRSGGLVHRVQNSPSQNAHSKMRRDLNRSDTEMLDTDDASDKSTMICP